MFRIYNAIELYILIVIMWLQWFSWKKNASATQICYLHEAGFNLAKPKEMVTRDVRGVILQGAQILEHVCNFLKFSRLLGGFVQPSYFSKWECCWRPTQWMIWQFGTILAFTCRLLKGNGSPSKCSIPMYSLFLHSTEEFASSVSKPHSCRLFTECGAMHHKRQHRVCCE